MHNVNEYDEKSVTKIDEFMTYMNDMTVGVNNKL